MAKTDKDPLKRFSALTDKALQRGEKLERTLTKLVAQSEPGSAVEDFLKAVQDGLKAIRKSAKSAKHRPADGKDAGKAEISKAKTPKASEKSRKVPRKPKALPREPGIADIHPRPEVVGKE